MIKEIILKDTLPHQSSGKFSISSVGGCWRKKYLELKGLFKEEFDQRVLRIFDVGNVIHRQMVKELIEKSPQSGFEVITAEANIPEHKYISGRVDTLISRVEDGKLFVIDYKSAGNWTFNKVKQGDFSSIEKNIWQMNLYLHLFKMDTGFLIFVDKATSNIEEVEVKYDKELAEKQISDIVSFFENNVEKSIMPEPCDNKPFKCPVCGDGKEW